MYVSVCAFDISKAYHRLAKQYHPDKNPSPDVEEKVSLRRDLASCTEVYNGVTIVCRCVCLL